ncbi:hypothetical protein V3C99_012068 [Haemonchus contortus]|uniref:Histone-lysine N-methyltransferase SETMAR n=1 Tax=Haemonchus contortus TaxID=6289 RepID=A0A7I4Y528_HAECO
MLERNATVNKKVYIFQLNHVNEAIRLKRPARQGQVILLHDNARPHIAEVVKTALQDLNGSTSKAQSPVEAIDDMHILNIHSQYMYMYVCMYMDTYIHL